MELYETAFGLYLFTFTCMFVLSLQILVHVTVRFAFQASRQTVHLSFLLLKKYDGLFTKLVSMLKGKTKLRNNSFFSSGGDEMQNRYFSGSKSGKMSTNGKVVLFKHLKVSFELKKQTQREQEMQHYRYRCLLPFLQKVTKVHIAYISKGLHLARTYPRIFVRGHYLLLEAHSFLHLFLHQGQAPLFIILQIILQRTEKMFRNYLPFIAWDVHFTVFCDTTLL